MRNYFPYIALFPFFSLLFACEDSRSVSPLYAALPSVAPSIACDTVYLRDTVYLSDNKDFLTQYVTPQQYGAVADDRQPDDEAFRRMFEAIQRGAAPPTIFVPPGMYRFSRPVVVKRLGYKVKFHLYGYGAFIEPAENFSGGFLMVVDRDDREHYWRMEGLAFRGPQSEGVNGLQLRGITFSQLDHMQFAGLDTALHHAIGWGNKYSNLYFAGNGAKNFLGGGQSTLDPSKGDCARGYNNNQIENCRVHGGKWKASDSHFHLVSPNKCIIRDCISEGAHPRYNLVIDYRATTCVGENLVDGFWIESQPHKLIPKNVNYYVPRMAYRTILSRAAMRRDTLLKVDRDNNGIVEFEGFHMTTPSIISGACRNVHIKANIDAKRAFSNTDFEQFARRIMPQCNTPQLVLQQNGRLFTQATR
jgi:hypothetical protein